MKTPITEKKLDALILTLRMKFSSANYVDEDEILDKNRVLSKIIFHVLCTTSLNNKTSYLLSVNALSSPAISVGEVSGLKHEVGDCFYK